MHTMQLIYPHLSRLGSSILLGAAAMALTNSVTAQGPYRLQETTQLSVSPTGGGYMVGSAVALEGDRAVVTAILGNVNPLPAIGQVYVLERDAAGIWAMSGPALTSSDGAGFGGMGFGFSVALSGDRIAVGGADVGPVGNEGAVYIFELDAGGSWSEVQKITEPSLSSASFGFSVAMQGDRLVAGAPNLSNPANNLETGAALAYELDSQTNQFVLVSTMFPSDGIYGDFFGADVDIDAETIVVGASQAGGSLGSFTGSAYVFNRNVGINPPQVQWIEGQKLVGTQGLFTNGIFGSSVAISGNTIAVGAPHESYSLSAAGQVHNVAGSVYMFELTGSPIPTTWTQSEVIRPSDAKVGMNFGWSMDLEGDRLLVGADLDGGNEGSAYLYQRSNLTPSWAELRKLESALQKDTDQLGFSVALSGDSMLVGAPQNDENYPGLDTGLAYVFDIPARRTAVTGPITSLLATPSVISLSAGGAHKMAIDAGVANAGRLRWVYGSGTLDPNSALALPFLFSDGYFQLHFPIPQGGAVFNKFKSTLDANGQSLATLNVPVLMDPTLIGVTLYHGYVVFDSAGQIVFASDAVAVTLVD